MEVEYPWNWIIFYKKTESAVLLSARMLGDYETYPKKVELKWEWRHGMSCRTLRNE